MGPIALAMRVCLALLMHHRRMRLSYLVSAGWMALYMFSGLPNPHKQSSGCSNANSVRLRLSTSTSRRRDSNSEGNDAKWANLCMSPIIPSSVRKAMILSTASN